MLHAFVKGLWLHIAFFLALLRNKCGKLFNRVETRNKKLQISLGTQAKPKKDVDLVASRSTIKTARHMGISIPRYIPQRDVEWSDFLDEKLHLAEQRYRQFYKPCTKAHFKDFFQINAVPQPSDFPNFNAWVLELLNLANKTTVPLKKSTPLVPGHRRYLAEHDDWDSDASDYYYAEE